MKPYFAKYLPVEGEIQPEDKAYFPVNGKGVVVVNGSMGELSIIGNKYGSKRAKLFLCSRDIQIGDKVIQNDSTNWEDTRCFFKRLPKIDDQGHHLEPHHYVIARLREDETERPNSESFEVEGFWFKIIGEISPDATWVTEGMKFDQEQVKFTIRGSGSIYYKLNVREFIKYSGPLTKLVEIKGRCGHFH